MVAELVFEQAMPASNAQSVIIFFIYILSVVWQRKRNGRGPGLSVFIGKNSIFLRKVSVLIAFFTVS